ncbi:two-component sensor histidine kinase, partial [Staphylococcus auricularis]
FFLCMCLRHNEFIEAVRCSSDIVIFFESKQIEDLTSLDLNASLGNFQKVILYNDDGNKLMETSNDNTIGYTPNFATKDANQASIKNHHNTEYLTITQRIDS